MKDYEITDTGSTIKLGANGKIISSIVYRIIETPEKHMYLHSAGTKVEEREKGHCKKLLKELEKKCMENEITTLKATIEEDNIKMKQMMQKLGYTFQGYENNIQKQRGRLLIQKIL